MDDSFSFRDWLHTPITTPMDFRAVVLATILIVSIAFLWTRVLRHVLKEG